MEYTKTILFPRMQQGKIPKIINMKGKNIKNRNYKNMERMHKTTERCTSAVFKVATSKILLQNIHYMYMAQITLLNITNRDRILKYILKWRTGISCKLLTY